MKLGLIFVIMSTELDNIESWAFFYKKKVPRKSGLQKSLSQKTVKT